MSTPVAARYPLTFRVLDEAVFGPRWLDVFGRFAPAYRAWFSRTSTGWPEPAVGRAQLGLHMPELAGVWDRLVALTGGGDDIARLLALWRPPLIMTGCSQAVVSGALVRNYDYHPARFEALLARTSLLGRPVLGMSDCLWGLLDGVNGDGLAASLAYGGGTAVGDGFAAPLVVRYVLETCATSVDARAALARMPVHMTYNFTVVDRHGDAFTAWLGPDRAARFSDVPVATNHQATTEWPAHAVATRSLVRYDVLRGLIRARAPLDAVSARLLEPPLHTTDYAAGFGTIYSAVYGPDAGSVALLWPESRWDHSLWSLGPPEHSVLLRQGEGVAAY